MAQERIVTLDDYEHRVLVRGLNDSRTLALRDSKPTEDLDGLILKVMDAPVIKEPLRNQRFRGERSRSGAIALSPKAEAQDTELAATRRRFGREAR